MDWTHEEGSARRLVLTCPERKRKIEVSLLPLGHDAWVVGEEPAVVVDFQGMIDYARADR